MTATDTIKKKVFQRTKSRSECGDGDTKLACNSGFWWLQCDSLWERFAELGPYNTLFKCFASDGDYIS